MTLANDLKQARYHAGQYITSERRGASITNAWHANHPKWRAVVNRLKRDELKPPLSRGLLSYIEHHRPERLRYLIHSVQLAPVERMSEWVYRWNDLQRWWMANRTTERHNDIMRDHLIDLATDLDEWDAYWQRGGEAWLRQEYKKQDKSVVKAAGTFGAGVAKSVATGDPTIAIGTIGTIGAESKAIRDARERASEDTAVNVNEQLRRQVERTIRALIQIESGGRADAVSPSGKHYGILQIGEATASDVGYSARDALNPQIALRIFMLSMQRSASIHRWDPMLMAFRWKAGTGTLKEFLSKAEVMGKAKALQTVASTGSSWRSAIPEYLRRFVRAWNNQ